MIEAKTAVTEFARNKVLSNYQELENEFQSLERQLENCKWKDMTLLKRYSEIETILESVKHGY